MDYKKLLKKYMEIIIDYEGDDFIEHARIECTDEEYKELARIADELWKEQ